MHDLKEAEIRIDSRSSGNFPVGRIDIPMDLGMQENF